MMHVLVTGAAGFIGRHLVIELLRRPSVDEVTALDDESFGDLAHFDGYPVRTIATSVLNRDTLDGVVSDADVVVHLATRWADGAGIADPLGVHEVNTTGSVQLLESARRSGHVPVILAGSRLPACPFDAVDAAAIAVHGAVEAARRAFGQPITEVVLPDVVGRQRPWGHPRGAWIDRTIREAVDQGTVDVDPASAQQPVVTVATASRLIADAALDPTDGARVVDGHPLGPMEVIAHVSRATGQTIEVRHRGSRTAGAEAGPWTATPAPSELRSELDEMIFDVLDQRVG